MSDFLIREIALENIFGFSLFLWLGAIAFVFLLATLIVGFLSFKGKSPVPFSWHPKLAIATLFFVLLHAIFAVSVFVFSF